MAGGGGGLREARHTEAGAGDPTPRLHQPVAAGDGGQPGLPERRPGSRLLLAWSALHAGLHALAGPRRGRRLLGQLGAPTGRVRGQPGVGPAAPAAGPQAHTHGERAAVRRLLGAGRLLPQLRHALLSPHPHRLLRRHLHPVRPGLRERERAPASARRAGLAARAVHVGGHPAGLRVGGVAPVAGAGRRMRSAARAALPLPAAAAGVPRLAGRPRPARRGRQSHGLAAPGHAHRWRHCGLPRTCHGADVGQVRGLHQRRLHPQRRGPAPLQRHPHPPGDGGAREGEGSRHWEERTLRGRERRLQPQGAAAQARAHPAGPLPRTARLPAAQRDRLGGVLHGDDLRERGQRAGRPRGDHHRGRGAAAGQRGGAVRGGPRRAAAPPAGVGGAHGRLHGGAGGLLQPAGAAPRAGPGAAAAGQPGGVHARLLAGILHAALPADGRAAARAPARPAQLARRLLQPRLHVRRHQDLPQLPARARQRRHLLAVRRHEPRQLRLRLAARARDARQVARRDRAVLRGQPPRPQGEARRGRQGGRGCRRCRQQRWHSRRRAGEDCPAGGKQLTPGHARG